MKISPDDFHYLVNQFLVHMINYDPQRVVKSERSERQEHNTTRTGPKLTRKLFLLFLHAVLIQRLQRDVSRHQFNPNVKCNAEKWVQWSQIYSYRAILQQKFPHRTLHVESPVYKVAVKTPSTFMAPSATLTLQAAQRK